MRRRFRRCFARKQLVSDSLLVREPRSWPVSRVPGQQWDDANRPDKHAVYVSCRLLQPCVRSGSPVRISSVRPQTTDSAAHVKRRASDVRRRAFTQKAHPLYLYRRRCLMTQRRPLKSSVFGNCLVNPGWWERFFHFCGYPSMCKVGRAGNPTRGAH